MKRWARFFTALGILLAASTARAEWHHYVVDSVARNLLPRVRMQGRTPHIAFYSDAGLEYAVWDSTGWVVETVDIAASFHNGNPALEFDQDGNPHIAWFRGTPWYARWDGVEWQREEIDTDSAGDYISMVLDAEGFPSVAYSKRRNLWTYMLKFARRDSQGWHPESVDSLGGGGCALAVDTLGRSCIAHCESWSSGAMFYSTQTDSGWVTETVVPDNASQSKMVLDENGDPHISFFWADGSSYDLRYAGRVGGVWRTDVVDAGQQQNKRGWDNWIVRDAAGTCHMSYHAHNEMQLRYAHGTYGDWQAEVVNTVGGWYLGSSIDLDELGRPVIAYCHENQAFRLYLSTSYDLTGLEEQWIPQPVEPMVLATITRAPELALMDCRVLDIMGRDVTERKARLSPGVYFLRRDSDASAVHKVMLQR